MLANHLGHWSILESEELKGGVDLSKYIGFVYVLSFEDGTKYIGAKKVWKRITKPPRSFKRGPRRGFEQSDWATYTSSSNEVNRKIDEGIYPSEYLIVGFYDSWGKTLYCEALLQLHVDIFNNRDVWLNNQIEGHFTASCVDDSIRVDIDNYMNYFNGNNGRVFEHDIYMNGSIIDIDYDNFQRIIDGRIDEYNGVTLPLEYQRVTWKYQYKDKVYRTQKEVGDDLNIKPKDYKSKGIKSIEPETRKMYRDRLKNINKLDLFKIKRRYVNG